MIKPPDSADRLCEHLEPLRLHVIARGGTQHSIARIWSGGRNFAVFLEVLDREAIRAATSPAACVSDHEHLGTHSGHEYGFACDVCKDGLVGPHPAMARGVGKVG